MPQGLQVFAPNGELIVDTNDRHSRIIASGVFNCPPIWYEGYDDNHIDIYVSPEFTNSPDFLVVTTGGNLVELFSTFFRYRNRGSGPFIEGSPVHWTAWAR
jgi:hypothetical protein